MKYLTKNKYWELEKEYNLDKLLYLLVDRPDKINSLNSFIWEKNINQWHRDYDLPAVICIYGDVEWHLNSKIHREKAKPAIIWYDSPKEWWVDGRCVELRFFDKK